MVANVLGFFDDYRLRSAPSDKTPMYRWAMERREKPSIWSADTLTKPANMIITDIKVNPPDGFA
jgi:hypothetical protein